MRGSRVRKREPKWEESKHTESPGKGEAGARRPGAIDRAFWLGAAVSGQEQFLPACLTGATWHLTTTRESAHGLLKNRQHHLLPEREAVPASQEGTLHEYKDHKTKKRWQTYQSLRQEKKVPENHTSLSRGPIICCERGRGSARTWEWMKAVCTPPRTLSVSFKNRGYFWQLGATSFLNTLHVWVSSPSLCL